MTTELNLKNTDDINIMNFPGYKFEYDNLYFSRGIARTGVLIKDNLSYSRQKKFENKTESIVMFLIGQPLKRNLHQYPILFWYGSYLETDFTHFLKDCVFLRTLK